MVASLKINVPPTKPMIEAKAVTETVNSDGDKLVAIVTTSKAWKDFAAHIDEAGTAKRKEGNAIVNSARDLSFILPERITYKGESSDVSVSRNDALKGLLLNSKLRSAVSAFVMSGFGPMPDAKDKSEKGIEASAKWKARKASVARALHLAGIVGLIGKWTNDGFSVPFCSVHYTGKNAMEKRLVPNATTVMSLGDPTKIDDATMVSFNSKRSAIVAFTSDSKEKRVDASFNHLSKRCPLQGKARPGNAGEGKKLGAAIDAMTSILPAYNGKALTDDIRQKLAVVRSMIDGALGIREATAPKTTTKAA